MAFSDPQSVTVGADTISLPRTGVGPNSGVYSSSDGLVKLTISHAYNKRTRRVARIDVSKVVSDPLVSGLSVPVNAACYIVFDAPKTGFSVTDLADLAAALGSWMGTGDNITDVLGGQS